MGIIQDMSRTREKKSTGKKKILWWLLGIAALFFAGFLINRIYVVCTTPDTYMVTTDNYFDYQKRYECSGYASAYVLRSLGVEADGLKLYNAFTGKNADGTLAPGPLKDNLRHMGYAASLHIGSLTDLKHAVSRGTPVVVLIRVKASEPYLHYVPVVGYDEDFIYVADSLSYMVNAEDPHYNRRIAAEDFKVLWKTDSFVVNNIYLTIKD